MEHATEQPAMNLREIVNRLHSENAKAHVIVTAVNKGLSVERDILSFAIESYMKPHGTGEFNYLGGCEFIMDVARKAGWAERSDQIREYLIKECERRHHYMHAADFAKKGGQGQRANEILARGARELIKLRKYQEASVCASKLGQDDLAEKILREGLDACEKSGDEAGVRNCLSSLGQSEKVREMDKQRKKKIRERLKEFWGEGHNCGIDIVGLYIAMIGSSTARFAVKIHLKPVANSILRLTSKVYEWRKDYSSAADFAEEAGKPSRAKYLWQKEMTQLESDGEIESAAYAAKKAGLEERAKKLFEKATDDYEAHSMFRNAIACAEEVGLHDRIPTYESVLKLEMEAT